MTTDFDALNREALERGMRDYERGIALADNPHKDNAATQEREHWREGWRNACELDKLQ